jgi:hypothetical protein
VVVARDNTVRLERVVLQIDKPRGRRTCARQRIPVRRHLNGQHSICVGFAVSAASPLMVGSGREQFRACDPSDCGAREPPVGRQHPTLVRVAERQLAGIEQRGADLRRRQIDEPLLVQQRQHSRAIRHGQGVRDARRSRGVSDAGVGLLRPPIERRAGPPQGFAQRGRCPAGRGAPRPGRS